MSRNRTALLIGVNLVLACLLAWLWFDASGGLRNVHWQPPAAIKPELGTPPGGSVGRDDAEVGRYMAMLDRPLFYPGRRPAPVAAKAGAPSRADPLDSLHIFGLFSGSDGGGALVRAEGKTRRLKLSEALGEWTLKEIRSGEAVFSRGGESRVVPLVQAKGGAGAGISRPTAAGPGLPMPFPGSAASPFPMATNVLPAPVPSRIDPPAAPSTGNAPAASPSNARPAPSSNPFTTGATR